MDGRMNNIRMRESMNGVDVNGFRVHYRTLASKHAGRQQQDYSIADSYTPLLSACVRVFELLLAVCLAFAEKAIRPVALPGSTPTTQRSPIYYSIHQLLSTIIIIIIHV